VTIGDVPAPTVAGSVTGVQYPATVVEVSSQWKTTPGGGGVDLSQGDVTLGHSPVD
jgi:hypothetical protein